MCFIVRQIPARMLAQKDIKNTFIYMYESSDFGQLILVKFSR